MLLNIFSWSRYYCYCLKLIILLLISGPISGQTDFRKGYLVSHEGDTIGGWIDYRGNLRNSNLCSYKSEKQAAQQNFDYTQIKGFGFNKTRYFISADFLPKNEFYDGFVEVLIQGGTSLYFGRNHYYIISKEKKVIQLINPTKKKNSSVGEAYITSDQYKYQLEQLFSSCNKLTRTDFKNTSFDHRSLMKIVRRYNECMEEESKTVNRELTSLQMWIGLAGEFQDRSIKFSSNSNNYRGLTNSDNISSQFLYPKIFLLTQLPFVNRRLTVGLEVSYFKEYFNANYEDMIAPSIGRRYSTYINYSNLKTNLLARYNIPVNRFSYFTELGFFNRIISNPTSTALIESQYLSTITIVEEKPLPLKTTEFGVLVGLGIYLNLNSEKKLFASGRFEVGNGLINKSSEIRSSSKVICIDAGLILPIIQNRER